MLKQKFINQQKLNATTLVALPVCFIIFAIAVTFIVNNVKSSVTHTSAILNESGVPLSWNNSITPSKDLVAGVSAELVNYDDYFVQYNPYIKNSSSTDHYLTHVASYLTTTSGDGHGFVPLDESTIEYTYTPDQPDSWQHLAVSAPANSTDGFKLATPLYIGADGTPMSTIYLRYGISADISHSDHLTQSVSFLTTDTSHNNTALSTTNTSLAYEAPDSTDGDSVIATADPVDDSDGQATKPLGVVSYVSNTTIIPSVHTADADQSNSSSIIIGQALLVIIIAVFCSSALLYISFRQI